MTQLHIQPGSSLHGNLDIPGDKSISHRALMLGALAATGSTVTVRNCLQSLDCLATVQALQAMGVTMQREGSAVHIRSVGKNGLQDPGKILDVGNSGTTIRLLTGILAAQKFSSVITGDASICKRPMRRIIIPLTQMGAKIRAEQDEFAPLQITGGQKLNSIDYAMPIASAQVKSAILLADLYAGGKSRVLAPQICRNHTEIMLQYFAAQHAAQISLDIPGDISAAAFFMVGASIRPGSDIQMCNVGINPTRAAIIDILRNMGADISCANICSINGELRADIRVRYVKRLRAVTIDPACISNAIDEIPVLCLAAACATGTSIIRGAKELRYKESDRIAMLAQGFSRLGIAVSVFEDGLAITGGVISGGEVASGGDHRIAMTFAMAGLVAQHAIIVQDTAHIATSFPGFVQVAQQAGMQIEELIPCPT